MEHELKRNMYCVPAGDYEHEAVILVGRTTGALVCGMPPYQKGHAIVYHDWGTMTAQRLKPSGAWYLTCADFIAYMYAMAEKRKASPPPEPQAGGTISTGQGPGLKIEKGLWFTDLEKSVANLETALDRHMINTRDGMRRIQKSIDLINFRHHYPGSVDEAYQRETKSADSLRGTSAAGAGDQVTNDEQVRYVSRLRMCYEDSEVSIRKDASPKNIPFEVALAYVKAGRKVTYPGVGWHITNGPDGRSEGDYVYLGESGHIMKREVAPCYSWIWNPKEVDLVSNDWMVLP